MPSSGVAGLASVPSIQRAKRVNITAAENGFVIALDRTTDYEQTFKVAKDAAEVAEIISAYFVQ